MTADAYSPLKALRHLDVIQAMRDGRSARPPHVQLILSDLCNQACGFCAYRDPSYTSSQMFFEIKPAGAALRKDEAHPERNYNPNRMIAYEKAIEILDDCRSMGVSGIQFTGGGEPTVHPRFLDILEAAQRTCATSLVTNGVNVYKKFWKDERFMDLFRRISWTRVSIDAGDAASYAKIRNVPEEHFTLAWAAVNAFRQASDAAKHKPAPVVGVGYVVTPDKWEGVYDACKMAKLNGAHNIRISAQFSTADEKPFLAFAHRCQALCEAADRDFTDDEFKVYNRFNAKVNELTQHRPEAQRCGYQEMTTYIGADLNVYRCCLLAYNERGLVGSIKDRRFKDLWLSRGRADEMRSFDARECDRCQFHPILKVIDYATRRPDPEHSEFV